MPWENSWAFSFNLLRKNHLPPILLNQPRTELSNNPVPWPTVHLVQCQEQRSNVVILTIQVGQRRTQGMGNQSGCRHGRLMDTQFVPANPSPAAGLVDGNGQFRKYVAFFVT